ncbi:endo alpha-1,4 polygalactosaminidase [Streptomyces sp. NPDC050504]|uniref:endo alpha-1,4 polygalactosaminidase n=1 Tax=Streptomyces sp. NPDC050504 TaxID=3365618 RepID=UPI003799477A
MRRTRSAAVLLGLALLLASCTSDGDRDRGRGDDAPRDERWMPGPGLAWQWQLSGELDLSVDVPVYDIDGFDHSAGTVAELHRAGRRVICYLSTGSWEDFRPDAAEFPRSLLGRGNGWPGERWLDVRRTDVLEPLMAARVDMCREKGFDAVEPDNMDGYLNATGFPLTAADQLRYNRLIARLVHARGMSVGLKNDVEQVRELVAEFDFAVNEQCARYEECGSLTPFVAAGKAVFHVEYELPVRTFCPTARKLGFSSMRKRYELDAWREAC